MSASLIYVYTTNQIDLSSLLSRSYEGPLWRGVHGDLTMLYSRGESRTWWSFSSCTNSLNVLESPAFVGTSGVRTMFSILESKGGRNISRHSHYETEDEILLLPGTTVEMNGLLRREDGFTIVQLRQVAAPREFLVLPDVSDEKQSVGVPDQSRQRFQQPEGTRAASRPRVFTKNDSDSSSDERPRLKRHGKYITAEVVPSSNRSDISEYSSSSVVSMKGANGMRSSTDKKSSSPCSSMLENGYERYFSSRFCADQLC